MLVLTRRVGQTVLIELNADMDPNTPVKELFKGGPLQMVVTYIGGNQVKIGIDAHPQLTIMRGELAQHTVAAGC